MHAGFFQQFIEWVIHHGGLYVLLFIIFAETGLFIGFFLPGDSLLFTAGIYISELAANFYNVSFIVIILLIIVATFTGSMLGFFIGSKTGENMFTWKDTFLFKKKYLIKAREFYTHYGKATVFLSKFLPIIRTFAPLVAGIVNMPAKTFVLYNLLGSVCWAAAMVLAGYFLQSFFLHRFGYNLKDHIETITVIIVLITTLPILYKFIFGDKKRTEHSAVQTKSQGFWGF